jgi:Ankyrin repeats (3 copies)
MAPGLDKLSPAHDLFAAVQGNWRNEFVILTFLLCFPPYYAQDMMQPLHIAAQSGNMAIVRFLVESGADIRAETKVSVAHSALFSLAHTAPPITTLR